MNEIDASMLTASRKTNLFSFSVYNIMVFFVFGVLYLLLISDSFSLTLGDAGFKGAKYIDDILFLSFFCFVMVGVFIRGYVYISYSYVWLMIFTIMGFIVSLINHVPLDVMLLGYMLIVKPIIIFIAYESVPLNKSTSIKILKNIDNLFMLISIVIVFYALIFDFLLGLNLLPGFTLPERMGITPARSIFIHPGPFSSIMLIATIYHYTKYLLFKSRSSFFLFLLSVLGIGLSLRMKAIFLLPIIIIFLYMLINFNPKKIKITSVVVGCVFIYFLLFTTLLCSYSMQDKLKFYFSQDTEAVRTVLLQKAMLINKDTFGFGAGFGMYGSAVSANYHYSELYYKYDISDLYGARPDKPSFITDQWWAWYLGEVGILGTIIFMGGLVFIIIKLKHKAVYWRYKNRYLATLSFSAIGYIIYGILSGFADGNFTTAPTGYYIMGLAGLVFNLHRELSKYEHKLL